VVFVFAVTQLAHRLVTDLSWYVLDRTLVWLLAMWAIWYRTVWTTNPAAVLAGPAFANTLAWRWYPRPPFPPTALTTPTETRQA
jgi:hypothetical protein